MAVLKALLSSTITQAVLVVGVFVLAFEYMPPNWLLTSSEQRLLAMTKDQIVEHIGEAMAYSEGCSHPLDQNRVSEILRKTEIPADSFEREGSRRAPWETGAKATIAMLGSTEEGSLERVKLCGLGEELYGPAGEVLQGLIQG